MLIISLYIVCDDRYYRLAPMKLKTRACLIFGLNYDTDHQEQCTKGAVDIFLPKMSIWGVALDDSLLYDHRHMFDKFCLVLSGSHLAVAGMEWSVFKMWKVLTWFVLHPSAKFCQRLSLVYSCGGSIVSRS
jgi:hypothetical protein